jgi:hypothetical protein
LLIDRQSSQQTVARDPLNAPWPTDANDTRLGGNVVPDTSLPAVTTTRYGEDIDHHRIIRNTNYEADSLENESYRALMYMLYRMPQNSVCDIVVVRNAKTALHGSCTTLSDQRDLIGEVWAKLRGNTGKFMVATTAGFYINFPHYHRLDYNSEFHGDKYYQMPVGKTSQGNEYFPIAPSISDLFSTVTLDYGFLQLPQLKGDFPEFEVHPVDINTAKGYLEYRAKDVETGKPIVNPINKERKVFDEFLTEIAQRRERGVPVNASVEYDLAEYARLGQHPELQRDGTLKVAQHVRTDKYIRTPHSYVGGGQAHGNQANERQLFIQCHDGTIIHLTLTIATTPGQDRQGWTLNDAYLIAEGALDWLGMGDNLADVAKVYNADGGPSVMLVILGDDGGEPGKPRTANLIAKGGQSANTQPRHWDTAEFWRIANNVIVTGPDSVVSKLDGSPPAAGAVDA